MRRKAKGSLSRHKEAKGAAGSFPRPRFFANSTFQGFLGILVPYGLRFTCGSRHDTSEIHCALMTPNTHVKWGEGEAVPANSIAVSPYGGMLKGSLTCKSL